ncbi:MAG TPA: flavodoxin domain-containing protein [Kofleriaceae bacterium]|nr:flavodoxin domain-containing protein [Kofleriaceae bacterium]
MANPGAPRGSEQRGRILLVYAQNHSKLISEALVARLREHGFVVEVGDARTGGMPPPEDYDGVVLGLPVGFGRDERLIAAYIHDNRRGLARVPSALFTVSASGSVHDIDPGGFFEQLVTGLDWSPDLAAAFAGGEPFPAEGLLVRVARELGYAPNTPSRDALRTSWTDVRQFADEIAQAVATAAVTAERTQPHVVDR